MALFAFDCNCLNGSRTDYSYDFKEIIKTFAIQIKMMLKNIIFDPVISIPLITGIGGIMGGLIIAYYFVGVKGTGRFRRLLLAFIRLCALFVMIVVPGFETNDPK